MKPIEYLSAYMPYGLELLCEKEYLPSGNISWIIKGQRIIMSADTIISTINGFYKPILRPLLDLTKEIEYNNEKFIPLEKIRNKFDYYHISLNSDGNFLFKRKNEGYTWLHDMRIINCLLFEWHFDIFNLIEQNLAIDINTLK